VHHARKRLMPSRRMPLPLKRLPPKRLLLNRKHNLRKTSAKPPLRVAVGGSAPSAN